MLLIVSFRDGVEHVSEALRALLADLDRNDVQRIALQGSGDADLADLVAIEAGGNAAAVAAAFAMIRPGIRCTRPSSSGTGSSPGWSSATSIRSASPATDPRAPSRPACAMWFGAASALLGVETAEVLSAGAVLGVEFDDAVLRMLVDHDEAVVDAALDAANVSGLLVPTEAAAGVMRFTDALVANALYAEIPPLRRRRLHERAAEALEREPSRYSRRRWCGWRVIARRRSPLLTRCVGPLRPATTRSRISHRARRPPGIAPCSNTARRSNGRTTSVPTSS